MSGDLDRILAEQREREGPPTEFDHRSCLAVLAIGVGAVMMLFALGVSVWAWAYQPFPNIAATDAAKIGD